MDTLELSRIQFALNISFHILFPAITIGLAWFLVYFKIRALREAAPAEENVWMRCYRFWVKIFALSFALGVLATALGGMLGLVPTVLGAVMFGGGRLLFAQQVKALVAKQRFDEVAEGLRRLNRRPRQRAADPC